MAIMIIMFIILLVTIESAIFIQGLWWDHGGCPWWFCGVWGAQWVNLQHYSALCLTVVEAPNFFS